MKDIDDARKAVAAITTEAHDDERAHCQEDELYHAFARLVLKKGDAELQAIAREILKTEKIDFARWYA